MNTPTPTTPRPSLWRRLRHAWAAFMGRVPRSARFIYKADAELVDTAPSPLESAPSRTTQRGVQPYNTQALPTAREQWQRGDWAALASLTLDELQDHPDRAKLAVLVAGGNYMRGNLPTAKEQFILAKRWGASSAAIKQIMIAGTHNTISNCWSILEVNNKATKHSIYAEIIGNIKKEDLK